MQHSGSRQDRPVCARTTPIVYELFEGAIVECCVDTRPRSRERGKEEGGVIFRHNDATLSRNQARADAARAARGRAARSGSPPVRANLCRGGTSGWRHPAAAHGPSQASQPCARATQHPWQHHLPSFLNRHRKWSITKKGLLGSSPQEQDSTTRCLCGNGFPFSSRPTSLT